MMIQHRILDLYTLCCPNHVQNSLACYNMLNLIKIDSLYIYGHEVSHNNVEKSLVSSSLFAKYEYKETLFCSTEA